MHTVEKAGKLSPAVPLYYKHSKQKYYRCSKIMCDSFWLISWCIEYIYEAKQKQIEKNNVLPLPDFYTEWFLDVLWFLENCMNWYVLVITKKSV